MPSKKHINNKTILPFCLLFAPLIGLGVDVYTPSLPAITAYFHVSPYAVKLTIILYLAVFGLSQPFVGIISDHFERKHFFIATLSCYVVSSFLSAFSPSIFWLYCFRMINSVCATAVAVVIKSMILDNFAGKELAKANNYFTLSWAVTPMIAPVIGGYLQHYFNWQANFYFMAGYAFLGLIVSFKLFKNQNRSNREKKILSFSTIIQQWKILFSDRVYMIAIFILAIENVILFLYYTAAPFIIQQTLHFTAAQYGNVMLFSGLSFLIGNLINDRLLNYFSIEKLITTGLFISLIVSFSTVIFIYMEKRYAINIYITTLPIFMLFMCDGLIFPNVTTRALSTYKKFSGVAGGLLAGGLNVLAAIIVALCAHVFDLHHLLTLNFIYFVMLCISTILFLLSLANLRYSDISN